MELVAVDDAAGRAPGRIACECGQVVGQLVCGRLLVDLELPKGEDGKRRTYRALLAASAGEVQCPACNRFGSLDRVLRQAAALSGALGLVAA